MDVYYISEYIYILHSQKIKPTINSSINNLIIIHVNLKHSRFQPWLLPLRCQPFESLWSWRCAHPVSEKNSIRIKESICYICINVLQHLTEWTIIEGHQKVPFLTYYYYLLLNEAESIWKSFEWTNWRHDEFLWNQKPYICHAGFNQFLFLTASVESFRRYLNIVNNNIIAKNSNRCFHAAETWKQIYHPNHIA